MNDFHVDFEVLLVGFVVLSGIIWLLDILFWAKHRQKNTDDPIAVEYAKSFFPVLLVVMILRSFILEPFRIPSGSMMPTLLVGDFILVNKYTYGIRLPVSHTKLTEGTAVARGDVAVFRYPEDPSLDFIKRVVGLPGDVIEYYNNQLSINGVKVDTVPQGLYPGQNQFTECTEVLDDKCKEAVYAQCDGVENISNEDDKLYHCFKNFSMVGNDVFETKMDDKTYYFMDNRNVGAQGYSCGSDAGIGCSDGRYVVPEGQYLVIGDNRDHSNDGRFWGFVPDDKLVGKAFMVWMHWDWSDGGSGLDLSRVGTQF